MHMLDFINTILSALKNASHSTWQWQCTNVKWGECSSTSSAAFFRKGCCPMLSWMLLFPSIVLWIVSASAFIKQTISTNYIAVQSVVHPLPLNKTTIIVQLSRHLYMHSSAINLKHRTIWMYWHCRSVSSTHYPIAAISSVTPTSNVYVTLLPAFLTNCSDLFSTAQWQVNRVAKCSGIWARYF